MKYYSLKKILSYNAHYNIIMGERSNGKTYATLELILKRYFDSAEKEQGAIIRRWQEDFKGKRANNFFNAHIEHGLITKLSNNKYNAIRYRQGAFYFGYYDRTANDTVWNDIPFCYTFSLSEMEHDKSTSYPNITTVMFDEFLTRQNYMMDEFIIFQNVLSTIIRERTNVQIFMLGNTVNYYSPYFKEMGLRNIKSMQQGTIDLYQYGETGLKVAVEFCKSQSQSKKSNVYFAFDNPQLDMIKNGSFEMALYPHLPQKFKPKDILYTYFILFEGEIIQCDIIGTGKTTFIYHHEKTTELQHAPNDIIFSLNPDADIRHRKNIMNPPDKIGKKILWYYAQSKVYFQDNEVGEVVNNYFKALGGSKKYVR